MRFDAKVVGVTNELKNKNGKDYRMLYICRPLDKDRGVGLISESYYVSSDQDFYLDVNDKILSKEVVINVNFYRGSSFLNGIELK